MSLRYRKPLRLPCQHHSHQTGGRLPAPETALPTGGRALLAQRHRVQPRHLPRLGRHGRYPRGLRRQSLPYCPVGRHGRGDSHYRPPHGPAPWTTRPRHHLPGQHLRHHPRPNQLGRDSNPARPLGPVRLFHAARRRTVRQTAQTTRRIRPRDDKGTGLLFGHRELLALLRRPRSRHASLLSAGLLPGRFSHHHRREPRDDSPNPSHVRRRQRPQEKPRRIRVPSAGRHRQPPPEVRRVRGSGTPGHIRQRHTGRLRAEQVGRGGGRTGHSSHGAARPRNRDTPHGRPNRQPDWRNRNPRRKGPACAGDHPHQTDGRRADQIFRKGGYPLPLYPLGCRYAGAHRDYGRPAGRPFRCTGGGQSVARGTGPARGLAGGHHGCRQGGFPAFGTVADPNRRSCRPTPRRTGHHVCRQNHRLDAPNHRRNGTPPRKADEL